jgi:hypothetical protein
VCSGTRHCCPVALGGVQSPARRLRAAADSTAGRAAAAMPRRPWLGIAEEARRVARAVAQNWQGGAVRSMSNGRARGGELALVPAGSSCCRRRAGKSEAATER